MKQAIIVRTDLKMSKGKIAAQASHASVESMHKSKKALVDAWRAEGAKKVVLKVDSQKELLSLQRKAKASKLVSSVIRDAGMTELKPGTITALGIGPDKDGKIDKVSGKLKAL